MKIIQLIGLCLFFLQQALSLQAQEVPQRIIVEHFTNTRCGICANRNPGFYGNLNSQQGVLHISFHPSSPYSSCVLNQANTSENDARTNFYNIYGGTPDFVLQGDVLPVNVNVSNPTIFDPYLNQTTPVELVIRQEKSEGVIEIEVDIMAVDDNSLGASRLFLAIAEDTVFYNAPNGEDEHYDVFRSSFNGDMEGTTIDIPATAGESLTLSYSLTPDTDWDFDRLFTVAILQDADDQSVIQTNATTPDQDDLTNTREPLTLAASVFPNPVRDQVQIRLETSEDAQYFLSNTQGQILRKGQFNQQAAIDLSDLPSGIYNLELVSAGQRNVQQLVKE